MTTDDDMREIEAALDSYGAACFLEVGDGTIECVDRTKERRDKLLALIRQKMQQPLPVGRADSIEEWRRGHVGDPGNIAVALELDASRTVPGMAFVVTEHDGTVTRFVPEVAQKPETCQQHAADVAQNDDEHERAVEAWRKVVTSLLANPEIADDVWLVNIRDVDEALRLMRARPVADKAAGDLLRAAKDVLHNFHVDMEQNHRSGFYGPQDVDAMHAMGEAIEAAERAGIGKNLPT